MVIEHDSLLNWLNVQSYQVQVDRDMNSYSSELVINKTDEWNTLNLSG